MSKTPQKFVVGISPGHHHSLQLAGKKKQFLTYLSALSVQYRKACELHLDPKFATVFNNVMYLEKNKETWGWVRLYTAPST